MAKNYGWDIRDHQRQALCIAVFGYDERRSRRWAHVYRDLKRYARRAARRAGRCEVTV